MIENPVITQRQFIVIARQYSQMLTRECPSLVELIYLDYGNARGLTKNAISKRLRRIQHLLDGPAPLNDMTDQRQTWSQDEYRDMDANFCAAMDAAGWMRTDKIREAVTR